MNITMSGKSKKILFGVSHTGLVQLYARDPGAGSNDEITVDVQDWTKGVHAARMAYVRDQFIAPLREWGLIEEAMTNMIVNGEKVSLCYLTKTASIAMSRQIAGVGDGRR